MMDTYKILDACPIADLHAHIEAESLDAIVTDPPYPKEYLSVYADLADFAIHALKPGGLLIAMVGKYYLPGLLTMLQKDPLRYHWLFCYYMPGQTSKIWPRRIGSAWKPLLMFVKGEYDGPWQKDTVFVGTKKDKQHHEWGQPVDDIEAIVEQFTTPGQLVCDPFLGGGSTAVAAVQLGRHFIGSDIDEDCVQITKHRLANPVARQLKFGWQAAS